ncbi:MAG: signal peptidase [Gemmatimonadetes bacterium]|nr:signal peptidase [Gemmatimonadota bacterium]
MPRPEPRQAPRAPAGKTATTGKTAAAKNEVLEWTKSLGVAVVLFVVIRTFLLQAFTIPSESMEKTLLVGDYLMASNVVFGPHIPFTEHHIPGLRQPRHGDIVVFRPDYNEPVMDVVKRLIGEPGDTVQMVNHEMYRNGKKLVEPYTVYGDQPDTPIGFTGTPGAFGPEVKPERYGYHWHLDALPKTVDRQTYHPTRDNWGPLVVPAGHYFLMGDNRDESLDSRFMGFIPREQIRGKPLFIYWSWDHTEDAPFPSFITAARWGRIGSVIH